MEIQKIKINVHIFSEFWLIYGTINVSVSWRRIPLQVVDLEQRAF